jgi:DNA-binding response OmpR family regulator
MVSARGEEDDQIDALDSGANDYVTKKQLRDKIEERPAQPKYLLTAPGVGYRLKIET